jgi:hypothetical protein
MLLLSEGKAGESWERWKKAGCFQFLGVMDRGTMFLGSVLSPSASNSICLCSLLQPAQLIRNKRSDKANPEHWPLCAVRHVKKYKLIATMPFLRDELATTCQAFIGSFTSYDKCSVIQLRTGRCFCPSSLGFSSLLVGTVFDGCVY